jgi:hypothetical protein
LDHCSLYIDLDATILFGGATDDQVAASSWGCTSKNEQEKDQKVPGSTRQVFYRSQGLLPNQLSVAEYSNLSRNQLKQCYKGIDNDIT